ncbi:MAG: hypothetical protein COB84_00590 [Rhodobacteraceae bacterium]|nr:MAG: hypothetical protein COB84_00590 [Paracoccaceae bacterium]
MPLLILFIIIPIIEIALFIQVGGFIGLWPTLAIVILTAVIGTNMLRRQGVSTLARLQANMSTGESPVDPMVHGAFILVAGVLLLTPGFFTDFIGFALLIPPVRAALIKWGATKLVSRAVFTSTTQNPQQSRPDQNVVDADYTVLDDEDQSGGDSGWTKH